MLQREPINSIPEIKFLITLNGVAAELYLTAEPPNFINLNYLPLISASIEFDFYLQPHSLFL